MPRGTAPEPRQRGFPSPLDTRDPLLSARPWSGSTLVCAIASCSCWPRFQPIEDELR
jgi:hypothetical protein